MKAVRLAVLFPALCLGACNKPKEVPFGTEGERGRFAGVGIYSTDRMWAQMVRADAPKSEAKARLEDDSEVIVVVDTRTGELRQCGNLSGYCVGLNPWAKPLLPAQAAPTSMLKHNESPHRSTVEADAGESAKSDAALAAKDKAATPPRH